MGQGSIFLGASLKFWPEKQPVLLLKFSSVCFFSLDDGDFYTSLLMIVVTESKAPAAID